MLYLMNTTVIPSNANGIWETKTLPLASAQVYVSQFKTYTSSVGHESTAEIMSELLKIRVEVNRIQVTPAPGDRLLCLKLKNRAPEGVILSKEEINELGYEFVLMTYHGTLGAALDAKFTEHSGFLANLNQRVH